MQLRAFIDSDWPQLWSIFRDVVTPGETFTYDPAITEPQARSLWTESSPGLTIVATDEGRVVGSAKMGANRPGPGSHVSTASFMVAKDARGHGVGTALCQFALDWARQRGFAGMQFNAVVETNQVAIHLYQRLGFQIVRSVAGAFAHPSRGRVALHIMYCEF